jgi:hypothetical protein
MPTPLTQLKIVVECAVRPVRASSMRKRRMREELLAHVTDVFEEERAALGDDQAALERCALRFGNSTELTSQLNASLRRWEWLDWHLENWPWPKPGESTLRFAGRITLAAGVILVPLCAYMATVIERVMLMLGSGICCLLFIFIAIALLRQAWLAIYGGPTPSWKGMVLVILPASSLGLAFGLTVANDEPVAAYAPACVVAGPFALIFLAHQIWRVTKGADRPWWRILLADVGTCVALFLSVFFMAAVLSADFQTSFEASLGLAISVVQWLILPDWIFRILGAYRWVQEDREWASLPMGAGKEATA